MALSMENNIVQMAATASFCSVYTSDPIFNDFLAELELDFTNNADNVACPWGV